MKPVYLRSLCLLALLALFLCCAAVQEEKAVKPAFQETKSTLSAAALAGTEMNMMGFVFTEIHELE